MSGISDLLLLVNSDMNEPLNYLHWINDLATFGTDSYVYNQPEKANELIEKSTNLFFNYTAIGILIDGYADKVFAKITGDTTEAFDGLTTMDLIVEDVTAMTAIANSETAMTAIANSEVAITAIQNSSYYTDIIPIMTNFTTPSGEASASSTLTEYYAWKAFNRTIVDHYDGWICANGQTPTPSNPQWLQYQLENTSLMIPTTYELISRPLVNPITPKDWILQGSNNGLAWTDLHTQINNTNNTAGQVQTFNFNNFNKFGYYRIFITGRNGSENYVTIGALRIKGIVIPN